MESGAVLHELCNCTAQMLRHPEEHPGITDPKFWMYIGIIIFLFVFAGLMSGLTLGLMSLGLVDLEVLRRSGTPEEKRQAEKIFPVVKRQHLLLVTLLLCNSAAMEALPIFLDRLVNPVMAVLLSVTLVLLFGEIIPQAVCSRYGLAVGASMAGLVKVLMTVCYVIAYPISRVLDWVLGESEEAMFRRSQLKALVSLHEQSAGQGGELTHDEAAIISGALDLTEKTAGEAMTPIDSTFTMNVFTRLDWDVMGQLLRRGHSRVPVYIENPSNPIGVLLVKSLITVRPEDEVPVSSLPIRPLPRVPEDLPLYDILNEFQKGGSHMAAVVRKHKDETQSEEDTIAEEDDQEDGNAFSRFGGRVMDMIRGAMGGSEIASEEEEKEDLEKGLLADLTISEIKETGEVIVEGSTLPVPGAISKEIYFSLNTQTGEVDAVPLPEGQPSFLQASLSAGSGAEPFTIAPMETPPDPLPTVPETSVKLPSPKPPIPTDFREASIRGGRIPSSEQGPQSQESSAESAPPKTKGPVKPPVQKPPVPKSPGKVEKIPEAGPQLEKGIPRINSFKARAAIVPDKVADKVTKSEPSRTIEAAPESDEAFDFRPSASNGQAVSSKTLSALQEGVGAAPTKGGVEPSSIQAGEVAILSPGGNPAERKEGEGSGPSSPISKWWGKKTEKRLAGDAVVGIITLEDVIEELLQEEIVDETDEYIDVHRRIRVANVGTAGRRIIQPPNSKGRTQGGPGRRKSNLADIVDRGGRSLDRDNEPRYRSRSASKDAISRHWHTRSYPREDEKQQSDNDKNGGALSMRSEGGQKSGLIEPLLASNAGSM